MISPILSYKLKASIRIVLFMMVVGTGYQLLTDGHFDILGPIIGLALGIPLAVFEEFIFLNKMRTQSFSKTVLTKTVLYLSLITLVFFGSSFFFGLAVGHEPKDFITMVLFDPEKYLQIGVAAVFYLVAIFFLQLTKLLGPGVLLNFVSGRYHRPKIEQRVFMFLDLKSSTSIAEELGHLDYYSFLNDFIRDISTAVIISSAQIYQYVGDEVVLTWNTQKGLENSNCIQVFFNIEDKIKANREHYESKYKVVPEFKAGVHCGDVVSAEIGDLKKDIVFNGDVLNTTARIQGVCNQMESSLLISSDLSKLLGPTVFHTRSLGSIDLRGKSEPMELMSISRNGRVLEALI